MSMPVTPLSAERLALADVHLRSAALGILRHDERLRDADVDPYFQHGVAHLTGAVDRPEQLNLARELIGGLAGVLAVWDRVETGGRRPAILDVGCGDTKQYPESIGVDIRAASGVDVLADVTDGLPVPDHAVDRIFAVHILEHLTDFLPLVDECHRVLRPDGVLHILSPWWRYVNAVADPTHVRLLDVQTVKGICARPGSDRRWYPLHVACDGASIFADLRPLTVDQPAPPATRMARFFD